MTSSRLPSLQSVSWRRYSVLGAACVVLGACAGDTIVQTPSPEPGDDVPVTPPAGALRSRLTHAETCEALLDQIQTNALVQLRARAEELKAQRFDGSGPLMGFPTRGGVAIAEDASLPVASPAPAAPSNNGTGASPGQSGGSGFSGTTVQVRDVDEADIVKAEGDHLYLLHGGTLFKLLAWPADATTLVGSAVVEGQPSEMFVHEGKAVVFSYVYDDLARAAGTASIAADYYYGATYTKVTVLDVSGDVPRTLQETFIEGDYVSARRHDSIVRLVLRDGFRGPVLSYPSIEYTDPFGRPYPQTDIDAQVDGWLARVSRSVQSSTLDEWLPRQYTVSGGELTPVAPRCGDYYAAAPGLTQSGITQVLGLDLAAPSAALSGVMVLGNAERVYANDSALLLAQTDYGSFEDGQPHERTLLHRFDLDGASTTYVASGSVPGYVHNQFSLDEQDGIVRLSTTENRFGGGVIGIGIAVPTPAPVPPEVTMGGAMAPAPSTVMTAPPSEPGMDVAVDGGVAPPPDEPTTAEQPAPAPAPLPALVEPGRVVASPVAPPPVTRPPVMEGAPINRVMTLRTDGQELVELGSTDGFGVNESIYSTRFIGDRAYVVTFRRTDPLFVVDLSNPADPTIVGDLHIPGFSDYLYPLGSDHLFAIGQDADDAGRVQGLALQIFDVSDETSPQLTHKYVFNDYGYSPANVDHRAITFHPDQDVVAFPFQSYQAGGSVLEVFRVNAQAGISWVGALPDRAPTFEQCLAWYGYVPGSLDPATAADPTFREQILRDCNYYGSSFRRGVFRDDYVYGISSRGVSVQALSAMSEPEPLASVALPAETYTNTPWGGGGRDMVAPAGTAPAAPPTMDVPVSDGAGSAPSPGGMAE